MLGNDNFVTGWAEVCNKQTATLLPIQNNFTSHKEEFSDLSPVTHLSMINTFFFP